MAGTERRRRKAPTAIEGVFEGLDAGERPGDRIGPYELLEVLGSGGFGVVYLAQQRKPIRRKVALKLIKLGMDTAEIVKRFQAEAQALAIVEHPNIAAIFDAGSTSAGRPYLVMEYVRGEPIDEYCNRHRLGVRQRLKLLVPICEALQHAHLHGIIHRDIKPSNLLVADFGRRTVPKIIDFGIVKALDGRLTDTTIHTQRGGMIGTLAYMSPEQAEGADLDRRADVYALGVTLYELLTGEFPIDPRTLRKADGRGVAEAIRRSVIVRPSARIDPDAGIWRKRAHERHSTPQRLRERLAGDLDNVVMKVLARNRARRYDSTTALAADLLRIVEKLAPGARHEEPVRRWRMLAAAGVAAVALTIGGWGLWQFVTREQLDPGHLPTPAPERLDSWDELCVDYLAWFREIRAGRELAELPDTDDILAAAGMAGFNSPLAIAGVEEGRTLEVTLARLRRFDPSQGSETMVTVGSTRNVVDNTRAALLAWPMLARLSEEAERLRRQDLPDVARSLDRVAGEYIGALTDRVTLRRTSPITLMQNVVSAENRGQGIRIAWEDLRPTASSDARLEDAVRAQQQRLVGELANGEAGPEDLGRLLNRLTTLKQVVDHEVLLMQRRDSAWQLAAGWTSRGFSELPKTLTGVHEARWRSLGQLPRISFDGLRRDIVPDAPMVPIVETLKRLEEHWAGITETVGRAEPDEHLARTEQITRDAVEAITGRAAKRLEAPAEVLGDVEAIFEKILAQIVAAVEVQKTPDWDFPAFQESTWYIQAKSKPGDVALLGEWIVEARRPVYAPPEESDPRTTASRQQLEGAMRSCRMLIKSLRGRAGVEEFHLAPYRAKLEEIEDEHQTLARVRWCRSNAAGLRSAWPRLQERTKDLENDLKTYQ